MARRCRHTLQYPGRVTWLFFADKDFVAIAFDSGSVATSLSQSLLSCRSAWGAASVIDGRSPLVDGFGLIGLLTISLYYLLCWSV